MRSIYILGCLLLGILGLQAQEVPENPTIATTYRAEREKVNDLVHTELKVSFDFANRHLLGEAWITLEPHFYNVNKVELDAKAMLIHKVSKDGKDLAHEYDGNVLNIDLANTYGKGEQYTIYIKYTARPEEVTQEGSAAITSAKGLYFIDPDDTDPDKPTQIWTQGETEASSCWFPTIDSPNQKTSQEIYMTVPNRFVTLSNGLLKEQKENGDGTRTDYWKFDQKHAPYLFFMGVGEYSVIKDKWRDLDVDYYVEEEYEPYARGIFGLTPEMMDFFSEYTGVDYVWPKYAQLVGRDYVSGAMENTTAVIHAETAYQTSGELMDENIWESIIAHELFHHWFGDLVTTESWSNLTVNESFANYSEYLWLEHKYGRERADAHRHEEVAGYITPDNELKDLVRFHYNSREDMFDAVSYNKGGTILHMLRSYLGDEAFREGIKLYLNDNKYGTAEAHQLRLAMEEVSGKDLNWFFNQWYFNNGHPKIEVKYTYSEEAKIVTVDIRQTQAEGFEFPLAIDVYEGEKSKRYQVWVDKKEAQFSFKYEQRPNLVNVDAERTLLAEWTDEKTTENLVHLYKHGKKYEDRREAIEGLVTAQDDPEAFEVMIAALEDPYFGLRILAIENIDLTQEKGKKALKLIENLAANDEKTLVKAQAIKKLFDFNGDAYVSLYKEALSSKSSAIRAKALHALYWTEEEAALAFAGSLEDKMEKESIKDALIPVYIMSENESEIAFVADNLVEGMFDPSDRDRMNIYKEGFQWVKDSDNEQAIQNLVDSFVELGVQYAKYGYDQVAKQVLELVLEEKKISESENRDKLVQIVEEGLGRLQ
jgi:aminopeptidase N